jgi:hypothetical protein
MAILVLEQTLKKNSRYRFIASSAVWRISLMTLCKPHEFLTAGSMIHSFARMGQPFSQHPVGF